MRASRTARPTPSRRALAALALALALGGLAPRAAAQIKTGTAAMPFLLIEPSAELAGMGNVGAAASGSVLDAYYNPGALGALEGSSAAFTHSPWLDGITYDYGAVAVKVGNNTLSLAVTSLASGDMDVRTVEQPMGTGERFSVQDLAIGVGVGRRFTDRFTAGLQAKYVQETIWHSSASAVALDAGVLYALPVQGVVLGASITNFGSRPTFNGRDLRIRFDPDPDTFGGNSSLPAALETDDFSLPVFFRVGVAMPVQLGADQQVRLAVDAFQPSDAQNSVSVGGEWSFRDLVTARAGFENLGLEDREGGLSFGGGLRVPVRRDFDVRINYAWTDRGRLGATQRFSLGLSF
jgi:hypothetical protein